MNGILPLWKEPGMTSHDCVFKIRKILKTKKVGHTGTLDPDVDGVLPICIGRATKIAEYITEAGKSYRAQFVIGESTETEDASGSVIEKKDVESSFSIDQLNKAAQQLTGEIRQTPPMYSAVKVDGRRLYEYARAGKTIERPSRVVSIHEIKIDKSSLTFDELNHTFKFEADISCGKGTYIRTLAVMLAELLGFPGHMSKLTRTSSAQFTASDCVTLKELAEHQDQQSVLKPLELGLSGLKKISVSDTVASKVKHGAVLPVPTDWPGEMGEPVAVFYKHNVLAIYHLHPEKAGMMKPVKVIWTG